MQRGTFDAERLGASLPQKGRSVAGIALNGKLIFIAQRKQGGAMGGKWEFPGGKADEGEGDEAALQREFLEEFGVGIVVGSLLAVSGFRHNNRDYSLSAYRIEFENAEYRDNMRLCEHSRVRWSTLEEINKLNFVDSDRTLFPALENYLYGQ